MLTGADRYDIRIVVLPREPGYIRGPCQRRPDAGDLVGAHLLSVPGAAQHCPETADVAGYGLGRSQAERRIVVFRVVFEGPMVDHLVTGCPE